MIKSPSPNPITRTCFNIAGEKLLKNNILMNSSNPGRVQAVRGAGEEDSRPLALNEVKVSSIYKAVPRGSPPRLAAPSWVIAGSIADNARFLAGKVSEVGLCFFETEASLAYGAKDLPPELTGLPLEWHAHLPLDLPWFGAPGAAADVSLRLMDKVAFLGCRRAVLHLPEGLAGGEKSGDAARAWAAFMAAWRASGRASCDLLLENQPGDAPRMLLSLADEYGAGLCLDFGHWLLTHGAGELPAPEFLRRVRMLHLNAPGADKSGHAALPELSTPEKAWAAEVLQSALSLSAPTAPGAPAAPMPNTSLSSSPTLMLELFSWEKIEKSLPILKLWLI